MSIRVLIVDDQELVRTGFRLFLETQPGLAVVGEAGDGEEAIERVRELRPDVVLMDIRMPTMDGVEATAKLTSGAIEPAARVLVLTTFDLDEYVFGALRAGAAGFLLKDAPRERLIEAIRVVHSGEALLSPSITRRLIEDFAARRDPIEPPAAVLAELTPPRARGARAGRAWPFERRDRGAARRHRGHGQEPRRGRPSQARAARPRPSGRVGLRARHRGRRRGRLDPPVLARDQRSFAAWSDALSQLVAQLANRPKPERVE